jgi:predicted transposase YdaD
VGIGLSRYHPLREQGKDELFALVAIFALAAGLALLVAIILEVLGRMVLLIPSEIKRLREQGRKEGRQEGLQEGRREERQRIVDALRQLGEREDGSIHITLTPEVIALLLSDAGPSPYLNNPKS